MRTLGCANGETRWRTERSKLRSQRRISIGRTDREYEVIESGELFFETPVNESADSCDRRTRCKSDLVSTCEQRAAAERQISGDGDVAGQRCVGRIDSQIGEGTRRQRLRVCIAGRVELRFDHFLDPR